MKYKLVLGTVAIVLSVVIGGVLSVVIGEMVDQVDIGDTSQFVVDLSNPMNAEEIADQGLQAATELFESEVASSHLPAIGNDQIFVVAEESDVVVIWTGSVQGLKLTQTEVHSWGFEGERVEIEIEYDWQEDRSSCLMIDFANQVTSLGRQIFWSCTESGAVDEGFATIGHNRMDVGDPETRLADVNIQRSWGSDESDLIRSWTPHAANLDDVTADCRRQEPRPISVHNESDSPFYARMDHCFPIEVSGGRPMKNAIEMEIAEIVSNPPPYWIGYGGIVSLPSDPNIDSWSESVSIEFRSCLRVGEMGCDIQTDE